MTKPGSRQTASALLLLVLLAPPRAAAAERRSDALLVWDFEQGVVNAWGGLYNVYQREPSWARTYLDPEVHYGPSGHSLRVKVHREAKGYCGVWMDLSSGSQWSRGFFNARPYRFLSFWIKGERGGEHFDFELSDETTAKREGSSPTRPLHAYLPEGVTAEWQEVVIPIEDFRGLDPSRLARVTLKFKAPGDYRFYLDQIAFKKTKPATVRAQETSAPRVVPEDSRISPRAMWVWNTRDVFADGEAKDEFFQFCAREQIGEIYLSLDLGFQAAPDGPRYDLRGPERYREFLERAHGQGLEVEALAGTPEWATRENHPFALAAVDVVLEFNRSSPAGARFDGIHFDVEPYVLIGYSHPVYRKQLLREFLQMVSLCAERTRNAPKLRFACDVPSWFYPASNPERQELSVKFNGQEKTVGEHLTDLLETVTIMDYHNRADGANGIIARGITALKYAAAKGKKIRVGLETFAEADSAVYFVCGLPMEEFYRRLGVSELRGQLFLGDFRLSTYSHGTHLHIGLSTPKQLEGPTRAEFERSLARLAREFGAASDPDRFSANSILDEACAAVARDPEWKDCETFEVTDPETRRAIKGFRAIHRMLPSITFHGLGRDVFNEETRSVIEWLNGYPSFAGFAIHFYDSFRKLMEEQ